ncbi:unnamed protein product [Urochloa humidicola]
MAREQFHIDTSLDRRHVFGVVALFLLLWSASTLPCSRAASCTCCDQKKRDNTITYSFPSFDIGLLMNPNAMAFLGNSSVSQGSLQLTPDSLNDPSKFLVNQSGSVLLLPAVKLWSVDSHGVKHDASFNTSFTMILYRLTKEIKGEGLAFVIVPTLNGPLPGSHGGFLGLTNTTARSASSSSFVAVEFDTVKQWYDPDDNHIGLNIGSIYSEPAVSLSSLQPPRNISLLSSTDSPPVTYTVWIDYNGVGHHIWVYMDVEGQPKPTQPHLDAPLNLSYHVPQRAYIGFSASTGVGYELNVIRSWNLTVDKLPADGPNKQWKLVLPAVLGSAAVTFVMISVAAFYFNSKYKELKMEMMLSEALRRLPGTPREFKYAMIRKATNKFHKTRKLGQGGFGAVYKGTLLRSGKEGKTRVEVAVKRFTRNDNRCYDDFLAEVDIINRLRHRNIVPLVGWCYQKGELLLIYEYMPNGSLDQHLFSKEQPIIGWGIRYNIVMDVAAGLHYVHHEHEHMVLHRDIKASNIMLDSTFSARLGDFGLARVVSFNKNSYTDLGVAGTWGFIAPEYSVCHKATRKTDVYAFGVLILEIATGRRALGECHETFQLLSDWVWKLHREGRLIEAIDDNVTSMEEFNTDDAIRLLLLGLACSNPNPLDRPSMAEVVQVIAKSAKPPAVPLVKPTFVWPPEGGIQLEFDEITAMNDLEAGDWDETSSNDTLAISAPSEINRRKQACAIQSRKCRSAGCHV